MHLGPEAMAVLPSQVACQSYLNPAETGKKKSKQKSKQFDRITPLGYNCHPSLSRD